MIKKSQRKRKEHNKQGSKIGTRLRQVNSKTDHQQCQNKSEITLDKK